MMTSVNCDTLRICKVIPRAITKKAIQADALKNTVHQTK